MYPYDDERTAYVCLKRKVICKMRVIAATKNSGKVRELSEILAKFGMEVVSLAEAGIDVEIMETGTTFLENAKIKARAVSLLCFDAVIADDSGLCVEALGGAPGIYSARYAGENASESERVDKLLSELRDEKNRAAKFVTALVLRYPDGREICTTGEVSGRITMMPLGTGGFGYDPIFYSTELKKTFGEASDEEKNRVSHRARAIAALAEKLDADK